MIEAETEMETWLMLSESLKEGGRILIDFLHCEVHKHKQAFFILAGVFAASPD